MSLYEEAALRNKILGCVYGKLPGYAFFSDSDIDKESIEKRIDWFKSFNTAENYNKFDEIIKNEIIQMINILNNED